MPPEAGGRRKKVEISILEQKLLALQKGEGELEDIAAEVCETLGNLGIGVEGGVDSPSWEVVHYFKEGNLWLDSKGRYSYPSRFGSLTGAVTAALSEILEVKSNALKRRNRQIRDLRRALHK